MFKITKSTIKNNETELIFYGIEDEKHKYNELSTNKEKVERLCQLFNCEQISELHYNDIIEDFINESAIRKAVRI